MRLGYAYNSDLAVSEPHAVSGHNGPASEGFVLCGPRA